MNSELFKLELDHKLYIRLKIRYKEDDKWKAKYKSTGIQLKRKSDWNTDKETIRSTEANYKEFNLKLKSFYENHISNKQAEKLKQTNDALSFLKYFENFKNRIPNYNTRTKCNSVLTHLIAFKEKSKIDDIYFEDLTRNFVLDFKYYLENTENQYKRKSAQNSTDKYIQIFRRVFNDIEDSGIYVFNHNPFKGIKLTDASSKKERISQDEYKTLLNIEQKETLKIFNGDTKEDIKMRKQYNIAVSSRDKFILQLQFNGMRVTDFLMLKWGNFYRDGGFLAFNYTASKTLLNMEVSLNEKSIKFLTPFIIKEMKRLNYLNLSTNFDYCEKLKLKSSTLHFASLLLNLSKHEESKNRLVFLSREEDNTLFKDYNPANSVEEMDRRIHSITSQYNKDLKELSKLSDLRFELQSHIARHSSAQFLVEAGFTAFEIMAIKGHKKLSTTQGYIKELSGLATSRDAKRAY